MASSTSTSSSASPSLPRVPDLGLAQWRFVARAAGAPPALRTRARDSLLAAVRKDQMAPFYRALCADTATGLALDDTLLKELTAANAARVAELDAKIADATENLGETEISDALIAKADYLARIGEKVNLSTGGDARLFDLALTAYKTASEKTGPLGTRIDIIFAMIRIGMFFSDNELISRNIEKART
ncbi:26S proteasome non-ATPase regulatory subunit 6, partial [Cladochytrium tenue]